MVFEMKGQDQGKQLDRPSTYTIRVEGRVRQEWSEWFNDLTITVVDDEEGGPVTWLVGTVKDQAELRALLNKIWNLNLTLISVQRIYPESKEARSAPNTVEGKPW